MSKTQNFRTQHDDLLAIAGEISGHFNAEKLAQDASAVRSLLSKLLGKLAIHLSMEDKSLYPSLLNHADEEVKSLAQKFIDEMGGIGKVLDEYKHKWSSPIAIQSAPQDFITETEGIFSALAGRIDKENNVLYNKVDQL